MRKLVIIAMIAATAIWSISASAAPNIYGENGLIEVPNDQVYEVGEAAAALPGIYNIDTRTGDDKNLTICAVGVGIASNLSVSGGVMSGDGTKTIINGKYRVSPETFTRPSVTVGIMDAAGKLSRNEDPALYVMVGKNLTAAAEEVAGGKSKPVRGYAGLGTGILKGFFMGLDWTLTPKLSAMLEYVDSDEGIIAESHFNGGIRYAVTRDIKIDIGAYDMKNLTAGVSLSAIRF